MRVVLDTNVFCQDFRWTGTTFRLLREAVHLVPADIKLPEVVVDEVVNKLRETLEDEVARAQKSDAALNRLLGRARDPMDLDIGREVEIFRTWFLGVARELGAQVLPYPTVPHKQIVERELQRRSPFKPNGAGYRDFLIWESIRGLMYSGNERVVFVTGNTRDFGKSSQLTDDLRKDLMNPERLELVQGLKEFNDRFVIPKLKVADELMADLQLQMGAPFDVPRWLKANLLDLLLDEEQLGHIVMGFPYDVGHVRPSEIVSFDSIEVDDVRELSDRQTLVHIVVTTQLDFSVDVSSHDAATHAEVRQWTGSDLGFSSSYWQHDDRLTIEVHLVLDAEQKTPISGEIARISGPYGSIDMTP